MIIDKVSYNQILEYINFGTLEGFDIFSRRKKAHSLIHGIIYKSPCNPNVKLSIGQLEKDGGTSILSLWLLAQT